jgi:phage terminase large subunit-like protein
MSAQTWTPQGGNWRSDLIALLPPLERAAAIQTLTPTLEDAKAILADWRLWARRNQLPPDGDWRTWVVLAGRGFGKTRTGAEWCRHELETGRRSRVALVAPTAADARDVMIEGESGILAIAPPGKRPVYEPSKRRITYGNGAIATAYSADEPDRLRGPQHDAAWCDELASWRYPETWDNLQLGLRLGGNPRSIVTTTPKPQKLLKGILSAADTAITRGATYDNRANLPDSFLTAIARQYEGTRLGRQELYAELLEDTVGALWTRANLDEHRVSRQPAMTRVVVAVDPAVTNNPHSDETGIVVCGLGVDGHGYVMDDRSVRTSPDAWARVVVDAYHTYGADRIIAEANNGGDLVELVIRTVDANVPYRAVRAARGKIARAEPVAALYEQGRVHHVGAFATLEDQLTSYVPDAHGSPDRLDALVWGLTELIIGQNEWLVL